MKAVREGDQFVLTFGQLESQLLRRALRSILHHYEVDPAQLDPRVAGVWYSTRGCHAAAPTDAEKEDWVANLHGLKSATTDLLRRWNQELTAHRAGKFRLRVNLTETGTLLTALNDHRLFLAATHDIGQGEMDSRTLGALRRLKPEQQLALYEIHLLAAIIEELLRFVAPEAANWME